MPIEVELDHEAHKEQVNEQTGALQLMDELKLRGLYSSSINIMRMTISAVKFF